MIHKVLGRQTERIDPKALRMDRVPKSDVSRDSFTESKFGKDSEGQSKSMFEVFPLFVLILEGWRPGWDIFWEGQTRIAAFVCL